MKKHIVNVVVCFHDADIESLIILERHLSPLSRDGTVDIWHRAKTSPGESVAEVCGERLRTANVILLLVSADFNAAWDGKIAASIRLNPSERPRVIPVIIRPCTWADLPFFGLQPVPIDGQPVVKDGRLVEERFHLAANAVRDVVMEILHSARNESSVPTAAPKTVIETLALLERERYEFERAASEVHHLALGTVRQGVPPSLIGLPVSRQELDPLEGSERASAPAAWGGRTEPGSLKGTFLSSAVPPSARRAALDELREAVVSVLGEEAKVATESELLRIAATLLRALPQRSLSAKVADER